MEARNADAVVAIIITIIVIIIIIVVTTIIPIDEDSQSRQRDFVSYFESRLFPNKFGDVDTSRRIERDGRFEFFDGTSITRTYRY